MGKFRVCPVLYLCAYPNLDRPCWVSCCFVRRCSPSADTPSRLVKALPGAAGSPIPTDLKFSKQTDYAPWVSSPPIKRLVRPGCLNSGTRPYPGRFSSHSYAGGALCLSCFYLACGFPGLHQGELFCPPVYCQHKPTSHRAPWTLPNAMPWRFSGLYPV